ncbi:hypothetical protein [Moorena sp. SIO4E2]|uniref:hypothetical protein n=1 Tax=Moorena sp. SIO4E2 TaxID=2607826 RepID=UPI00257F8E94|nr:hypothetical protein [Moorena sp. SIO4E2]
MGNRSANDPFPITHYPLPITHYPLPITYYLLPISKVKNLPLSATPHSRFPTPHSPPKCKKPTPVSTAPLHSRRHQDSEIGYFVSCS